MIDLEAIRVALVEVLQGVGISTTWLPYPIALDGLYPAGVITYAEDDVIYDETFDRNGAVFLDIELSVRAGAGDAQRTMDRYLSRGAETRSVLDVLDDDSTLGGLVMSCTAPSASVGPVPADEAQDYVARVHLRIMP